MLRLGRHLNRSMFRLLNALWPPALIPCCNLIDPRLIDGTLPRRFSPWLCSISPLKGAKFYKARSSSAFIPIYLMAVKARPEIVELSEKQLAHTVYFLRVKWDVYQHGACIFSSNVEPLKQKLVFHSSLFFSTMFRS